MIAANDQFWAMQAFATNLGHLLFKISSLRYESGLTSPLNCNIVDDKVQPVVPYYLIMAASERRC